MNTYLLERLLDGFVGNAMVAQVDESNVREPPNNILRGLLLLRRTGRMSVLAEVNDRNAEGILQSGDSAHVLGCIKLVNSPLHGSRTSAS